MAEQNRSGELLDRAVKLILEALAQECDDLHRLIVRGRAAAFLDNEATYATCGQQVEDWFADHERAGTLPLSARVYKALGDLFPDMEGG